MIDRAYQAGVNYFDTAFFYHQRTSEAFMGRVLQAYPRDSFYLATKLPMSLIHTLDEAKEIFEGQFTALDTDYFDFYLLHALNDERWQRAVDLGILDFLIEQQKKGRIRRLGFSFHDSYEVFEKILTYREWDFCQIQYNYMDTEIQAGDRGYELAERLGVPMVIMEPVKGGSLAVLSDDITSMFRNVHPDWSTASWAMRWVASHPNCRIILSGMSDEAQVEDNLKTFSDLGEFGEAEKKTVDDVRAAMRAKQFIGCTGCRYCMPCPFGVDIPGNFKMMNDYAMYQNKKRRMDEWTFFDPEEKADNCRKCGKCEEACPQKLSIRALLSGIADEMQE